jgi:glucose dehydrogenase
MRNRLPKLASLLIATAAIVPTAVQADWDQAGTSATEQAPSIDNAGAVVSLALPAAAEPFATSREWPSYSRTLTSERYSPLNQINATNIGQLKVLCTYDTHQYTSFEAGPIMVQNALIGTTEHDIFSIDPGTCRENWRTHEDFKPASPLAVNRGAAYMDGLLFRGTEDGRLLAYDFKTGRRIWATTIGNPALGESTPAAPITWIGYVFIGNAGGDNKGVKGRMYALKATTGEIVWEFYPVPKSADDQSRGPQSATPLDMVTWQNAAGDPVTGGATRTSYTLDTVTGELSVPGGNPGPDVAIGLREAAGLDATTGAYQGHFKLVPKDWHDWDVSSAPKDGNLYGFDLYTNTLLYRVPVTTMENADASIAIGKHVHFCPGTAGAAEWNGPAYDPRTSLVLIGEVDWCSTVTLQTDAQIRKVALGKPSSGTATISPYHTYGTADPSRHWAGWIYAVDADSGGWKWRLKSHYPILSGMTPTGGDLVFFGDMSGNFYALDATNGQRLWGHKIGGAIGGGVITYTTDGVQKVAVATGFTSIFWPTAVGTGKIVILGL